MPDAETTLEAIRLTRWRDSEDWREIILPALEERIAALTATLLSRQAIESMEDVRACQVTLHHLTEFRDEAAIGLLRLATRAQMEQEEEDARRERESPREPRRLFRFVRGGR